MRRADAVAALEAFAAASNSHRRLLRSSHAIRRGGTVEHNFGRLKATSWSLLVWDIV